MANLKNTRTRKRGIGRIYSHTNRIKYSKQSLSINNLLPGQICTFSYRSTEPKNYDNNPLILFLYLDKKTGLVHALNLHYLNESQVQNLFKSVSKVTSVDFGSSKNLDQHHIKVELSDKNNSKTPTPQQLYDKAIKPLIGLPGYKNAYRTFSSSKINGAAKIINYRLDIVEKEVREQTELTQGELTTKELFKAVEEQDIKVKAGKQTQRNSEDSSDEN